MISNIYIINPGHISHTDINTQYPRYIFKYNLLLICNYALIIK